MNYKKEYLRLKAKVNTIKCLASGIGLAIVWASIFVYWAISKGVR